MRIIGAGLAGLLAAKMLWHKKPMVLEKQSELPNNHSAVLRFRSQVVGDVTGIEFRKVQVIKASIPWKNPIADALAYSDKNTGILLSDRSMPTEVISVDRYIAPTNLIELLSANIDIRFNITGVIDLSSSKNEPIISTMPMPDLMTMLDYSGDHPPFVAVKGSNIRACVHNCDAYVSLYVPNPFYPFSRISLTGDEIIAEVPHAVNADPELIFAAAGLLGIARDRVSDPTCRQQTYSKIQRIDEGARKRFIAWASDEHNIYSLGRFATWRPGLLLDDLVKDIRLIEHWISDGNYSMRRHR